MNKKIFLLSSFALLICLLTGCYASVPIYELANVEDIEMIILETFPVQVQLAASGYLPDPCTIIYQATQERTANHFLINISTYRLPGACIQIIVPFKEVIPLEVEGLSAGTYTVEVNGIKGSFILAADNTL